MAKVSIVKVKSAGTGAEKSSRRDTAVVSPLFRLRVTISYVSCIVFMLPVSFVTGYITGGTLSVCIELVSDVFAPMRPMEYLGSLPIVAGFAAGGLTLSYFFVNLDRDFIAARLRGEFTARPPTCCSRCGASLLFGQVLCGGCGTDLRGAAGTTLLSYDVRRKMFVSHLLGTVPMAIIVFFIVGGVTSWATATYRFLMLESFHFTLGWPFAATGGAVLLRVPRAIFLWRMLNAEKPDSGQESH